MLSKMNNNLWHQLNAILGSLIVTIGLWLLVGALPLPIGLLLAVGLAILLAWKCPSIGYVWAAATLLLGMESFAWPIMQMADMRKLGPEPPLEELQRIFTAVLFGLFSGIFWMTFAYGIFKRTRALNVPSSTRRHHKTTTKKKSPKGSG